jgi:hypothetical protein
MIIQNEIVTFDFLNKKISRRVSNTHARPGHQPIYIEKNRTDTDIYICSQRYYKNNNIKDITGFECPKNNRIIIDDFVIKKEAFNSYVKRLKSAFKEFGLNEFYKDEINDIYTIIDDLKTSLVLIHSTQQKIRIGFGYEPVKKIIFDSFVGDLTQIEFDFKTKEIHLSIPKENLLYLLEEVGKAKMIISDQPEEIYDFKDASSNNQNSDNLLNEARTLQMYHDELIQKYGEDGTVVHEMLKTRSSSLQSYFRDIIIQKYGKCLLCDISSKSLLIASHIKPASKSNTIEKSDVNNGLLLCPLHDKLFDMGFITFNGVTGELIISKSINNKVKLYRLDTYKIYSEIISKDINKYMIYHNENVFRGVIDERD